MVESDEGTTNDNSNKDDLDRLEEKGKARAELALTMANGVHMMDKIVRDNSEVRVTLLTIVAFMVTECSKTETEEERKGVCLYGMEALAAFMMSTLKGEDKEKKKDGDVQVVSG